MWQLHAEKAESALAKRAEFLGALALECGAESFDRFTAALIFTELVGNVIRHADGPVDIQVRCIDGFAQIHVYDRGNGFEYRPQLPRDSLAEGGRGLYLISQYSKRVSVQTFQRHGTCVSAVFALRKSA
ncbi:MAG: ATP-binding protein [Candidatus Baltobacteraceae bacterium]